MLLLSALISASLTPAQATPLAQNPRIVRMNEIARERMRLSRDARIDAWWSDEQAGQFKLGSKLYSFRTDSATAKEADDEIYYHEPQTEQELRGQVERGGQYSSATTRDGSWRASFKDNNIFLTAKGGTPFAITTDGNPKTGIKYGKASWVYGEELEQSDAMGFSPDGSLLWFYRFDESKIPLIETVYQSGPRKEAYPLPGAANPEVDLYIHNMRNHKNLKIKVRPGAFDDGMGHYVCGMRWATDSSELYFVRMNRLQNDRQICAVNPGSGAVRIVDEEAYPKGWVEYTVRDESQGHFPGKWLIKSEASGSLNYTLIDPKAAKRTQMTHVSGDVTDVVKLDDKKKELWFMATDPKFPLRHQLYRVGYDGQNQIQITSSETSHSVKVAPTGDFVIDRAESASQAPKILLLDRSGKQVQELAKVDASPTTQAGFTPQETFSFMSFDGTTRIWGVINKPKNFDPAKRYPIILDTYAGPLPWDWGVPKESWTLPDSLSQLGVLTVHIYGRGEQGRGRAFRQAIYGKLGLTEIDDQAAGISYLRTLPYVDGARVAIKGTSYGGYTTSVSLLRYPQLYRCGVACSIVADWRLYDSTYTERYMGLPQTNKAGYDAGSAILLAPKLQGKLLLYYGTSDDNTHPANALQFMDALKKAKKPFQLEIGQYMGHSAVAYQKEMTFLLRELFGDKVE